jgi:hypothetical protein
MLRNAIERRGRDPQEVDNRLSLIDRFWYTPEGIASAALWLCSSAWGSLLVMRLPLIVAICLVSAGRLAPI